MATRGPKMSLLAQYDDLCRYSKVLTSGSEEEFKIFIENQLNSVRKWKKTDAEVKKLRSRITNLESENGRLETKIKHLKNLLEGADAAKRKTEWDKKCLERTIAAVRDVILSDGVVDNQTREKLAFLNSSYKPSTNSPGHLPPIEESAGSLFSLSDIDQTDDDLESCRRSSNRRSRRSRGKRSNTDISTSFKRKKLNEAEEFLNKINAEAGQQSSTETASTSSEPPVVSQQPLQSEYAQLKFNTHDYDYDTDSVSKNIVFTRQAPQSEYAQLKFNTYNCHNNTDSVSKNTVVTRQASSRHFSKNHDFVSKRETRRVKCLGCRQFIGYLKQSLKCQSCGITCHFECKDMCPPLCFPITNTPTKGTNGTVSDYTSSSSPMIPPLIFHCVREIESRGIKDDGLYREPGSIQEVKSLINKFVSGRIIPILNNVDINVLCGAVKTFLLSLNEPLITHKTRRAFIDAAKLENTLQSSYALLGLVSKLPQPNRDTLSFLILHWQKIAESPHCKMNIEAFSRLLGPTILGYSAKELSEANIDEETANQYQVVKRLLSISTASWQSIMSVEIMQRVEGTPENLPVPRGRLLGPVYASVQKKKSMTLLKTPLTPRNSKSSKKPSRTHFSSPLLK